MLSEEEVVSWKAMENFPSLFPYHSYPQVFSAWSHGYSEGVRPHLHGY